MESVWLSGARFLPFWKGVYFVLAKVFPAVDGLRCGRFGEDNGLAVLRWELSEGLSVTMIAFILTDYYYVWFGKLKDRGDAGWVDAAG